MEHYQRLCKIGEGTSGVVYKARDLRTGETVAIKRLRSPGADAFSDETTFRRELRCLEACRGHPSLVNLLTAHLHPTAGAFLVMEYAGHSLTEAMRRRQGRPFPFSEAEARHVMRRLLEGVAAMHARGLLHRDLKPDNVLLLDDDDVKICDFGLSRRTRADSDTKPYTTGVATLWYRAPEVILGSQDYDGGVDTWAAGCIMAELLLPGGHGPLFPGRSEMDQLNRVLDTVGGAQAQDMAAWPGFASLPRAGSPLCARARPPGGRLREMFPALSAPGFDVLAGLLACRPDRRLAAADALRCPWFAEADSDLAAAADAVPDQQPRAASCCAGGGFGVAGVAEAGIVA